MRPDARIPQPSASFLEEDSNGWLVTFSDLVLQLFAFVMVAAVLGAGSTHGALRPGGARVERVAAPATSAPERTFAEPDALSMARFDDVPPPAAVANARSAAPMAASADGPTLDAAPAPRAFATRPERAVAAVADPVVPPAPPLPERSLASELERFVVAAGLGDAVRVSVAGGGVTLSISDTIGFASGRAELLPDAAPVLAEVRDLVAARPELSVEVSGHTDDRPLHAGPFRSNLDLSLARAARVAHELAGGDAALTSRIFAAGYGAARPIASNEDADGRARNRRVELRLVRQ